MPITFYGFNITTLVITKTICGTILIITFLGVLIRLIAHIRKRPSGPILSLAPGAVVSLGILGTFLGIYLGLRNFNTADINASIPELLEGLKTAFITSIFGMFFSFIIKYVYGYFDRQDIKKDPIAIGNQLELLRQIAKSVSSLSTTLDSIGETIVRCFKSDEEYSLVSQLKLLRTDMNDLKREIIQSLNDFGKKVAELGTEAMIKALREVIAQFNARLNDLVGAEFKQLKEAMVKLVEWQENHRKAVDEMQNNLSVYLQQVRLSTELIEKATRSIGKASENLDSIDGSLSTISVSAEDIERHIEHLRLQNEQLREFIGSIRKMGEEAQNVLPSIAKHIESSTTNLVEATHQTKNKLQEASAQMESFTDQHTKQVDQSIKQIQRGLGNVLNTSLKSLGEELASL